jgi:hypothetical protein
MLKIISQIAASALIAGVIVFLTPVAPQANVPEAKSASQVAAKADRLTAPVTGAACSQRAWPHYEQNCLFDNRRSAGDVRKVSVVNLDRRDMPARAAVIEVASR